MRLKRTEIQNFRSIAAANLEFDPLCRILVGINECGKSNLLKALALLSPDEKFSTEDLREAALEEDRVEKGYVRFILALDREDLSAVTKQVDEHLLFFDSSKPLLWYDSKPLAMSAATERLSETIYNVDIGEDVRQFLSWKLPEGYTVDPAWKKPSTLCPDDFSVFDPQAKPLLLRDFQAIHTGEFPDIPPQFLETLTVGEIVLLIQKLARKYAEDHLPACIFWKYEERYLLPSRIKIDAFKADPNECLPLRYMFELAGIADIAETFDKESKRTTGLRNLLHRVAETATKHLRKVWKEASSVAIELIQNGDVIDASVKDTHNYFGFSRRSDGFKRFVTFLLMISARVHAKSLKGALLLYDEPEISLHPSGAKYLRNELLQIARDNIVVYSTHSPYMIDRDRIERHLIVKKVAEKTELQAVDHSNFRDEEVIFNAMGASLFDVLKEFNIVFEGRRDLVLFERSLERLSAQYQDLKKLREGVGKCFVRGAKAIKNFTPILALANRRCVIVSDSDAVARQEQQQYDGWGKWFRYDELVNGCVCVTAEDFIKPEAFVSAVEELRRLEANAPTITVADLNDPRGKLETYMGLVARSNQFDNAGAKRLAEQLKEQIFENLKQGQIDDRYYGVLRRLLALANDVSTAPSDTATEKI